MIKRIVTLVTVGCFLCLALVGCGCSNPNNIDEKLYDKAEKAVEVTEKYLDADLTAEQAQDKITRLDSQIESFRKSKNEHEKKVANYILDLYWELIDIEDLEAKNISTSEKDQEIQKTLDKLKEEL